MRISIDHQTRYRFEEPQARVVQLLHMRPCDTNHQTVVAWRVDIDCDARLRKHEDGFGNEVTMVYADGPLESITIEVTGEILTDNEAAGVVHGAPEPLPPALFLRQTARTRPDDAIRDYADGLNMEKDALGGLHALCSALCDRFEIVPVRPDHMQPVGETFATKSASPHELAELFCSIARTCGFPARFIAGYRVPETEKRMASLHAWAEAYIEGLGWVGFDPACGISPDERYVRVAAGLDASDTAASSGSRTGGGEEAMDVDIDAHMLGAGQH